MSNRLVQNALMSSVSNVNSYRELPKVQAIEIEITPTAPKSEALFGDTVHSNLVVGGKVQTVKESHNNGRREVKLARWRAFKNSKAIRK